MRNVLLVIVQTNSVSMNLFKKKKHLQPKDRFINHNFVNYCMAVMQKGCGWATGNKVLHCEWAGASSVVSQLASTSPVYKYWQAETASCWTSGLSCLVPTFTNSRGKSPCVWNTHVAITLNLLCRLRLNFVRTWRVVIVLKVYNDAFKEWHIYMHVYIWKICNLTC